jgi:co-chaperonin GroES (HSP10)
MRGEMIQSDVQVGDRVVFTKYRPTLMEFPLLNGDSVYVELMTISDIYVRWR